jgi:hypothetical protein
MSRINRVRQPQQTASNDPDELSGGNAGFEHAPRHFTQDEAERREYMYGQRTGMAQGLVGGMLIGAVLTLGIMALGFYSAVGAW